MLFELPPETPKTKNNEFSLQLRFHELHKRPIWLIMAWRTFDRFPPSRRSERRNRRFLPFNFRGPPPRVPRETQFGPTCERFSYFFLAATRKGNRENTGGKAKTKNQKNCVRPVLRHFRRAAAPNVRRCARRPPSMLDAEDVSRTSRAPPGLKWRRYNRRGSF